MKERGGNVEKSQKIRVTDRRLYVFDEKGIRICQLYKEKQILWIPWEDVVDIYVCFYDQDDMEVVGQWCVHIETRETLDELGSFYLDESGYLTINISSGPDAEKTVRDIIDLFEQTSTGQAQRQKNYQHPFAFFHIPPRYYDIAAEVYQPSQDMPALPIVAYYKDTNVAGIIFSVTCISSLFFIGFLIMTIVYWGTLNGFEKTISVLIYLVVAVDMFMRWRNPLRQKIDDHSANEYSYLMRRTKMTFSYYQIVSVDYWATIITDEDNQKLEDTNSLLTITLDDGRLIRFPHEYQEESTNHYLTKIELAWFLERMRRKYLL